ncbi:hypothetical protein DFR67_10659 [Williamsia limnetica]|uniref:Uncharacterized protein n=1 Tax=Williamsia limnetica TaxID=882452 RepID=A0A318RPY8_WILLI|nr:hypothetical protein [Williamsia limnetica]PYE17356.1 hypothetical protein DFR67_10659 [Williamsia limnetica]
MTDPHTSDDDYDPDADPDMLTSTTQQPDQAEGDDDATAGESPASSPGNKP